MIKNSWYSFILVFAMGILLQGCGSGSGSTADSASVINPSAPSKPTGLNAQVVSMTQIDLSWDASTDDGVVAGYKIEWPGHQRQTAETSYRVDYLTADTQYCFTVTAYDDDYNYSPVSEEVCVSTNPFPWVEVRRGTSHTFTGVVWTGSQLLSIEESTTSTVGIVYTSIDGMQWERNVVDSFFFIGADTLVYGGGQYIAVHGDWYYRSTDGIAWSLVHTEDDMIDVSGLAWSPTLSKFVAVGESGYICVSTDSSTWTRLPAPTVENFSGVSWVDDRFYAVGTNSLIMTSLDGVEWSTVAVDGVTGELYSVAYNGKSGADARYVITGYNTVLTAGEDLNWTEIASPPAGFFEEVVWGGDPVNMFVAVGDDNSIYTSPNGENWTRRFVINDDDTGQLTLKDVVWTGTRFVVVGAQGTTIVSDNGLDWQIVTSGAHFNGLVYIGSEFLALGNYGRTAASTNGDSWEYRYLGADYYHIHDLATNGSNYVAVGQTYSLVSDDLTTWNSQWMGATTEVDAIVWDGSKYLRAGDGILSWDGVTYITGTTDIDWQWSYFGNTFNDLHWDGNRFVAVGFNGVITSSLDATDGSWTDQNSTTTNVLYAVAKNDKRYVVVGAYGTILTSDDNASTWTVRDSGSSDSIYGVTWTGSQFVAVGYYGLILTSDDGVDWTKTRLGTYSLRSVLAHDQDVVIVGDYGTVIRNNY